MRIIRTMILSKGAEALMSKITNINYIIETESYIEKHKNEIPENVYEFIKVVCQDERKYINLVESFSNQKGILKKPEAKAIQY
jgi:hypothetical protein